MSQPRLLNHSGIAVSIVTHLMVLTIGLGSAGVRPFETTPIEAITVDIVSPDEARQATRETPPKAAPQLEIPDLSTKEQLAASEPAPAPQPQQQVAQEQASAAPRSDPKADAKQAATRPAAAAASQAPAAPQPAASWRP